MSSATHRRDDISRYYKPVEQAETVGGWLFWANMLLCIVSLAASPWTRQYLPGVLEAALLLLVVIQALLAAVVRLYLSPRAMDKRRKQLLADSLGVVLNDDRTEGYYNNPLSPSLKRLAVNTFENAFFSKEIVGEMLVHRRWRTGIYLLIWLSLVVYRNTSIEVLAFVTQVVFSADVVFDWLNLEALWRKHEATYDHFYSHFASRAGYTTPTGQVSILDGAIGYECDKARAGVQQSSAVFSRRNAALSEKWDQIRKNLQIDPEPEAVKPLEGPSS